MGDSTTTGTGAVDPEEYDRLFALETGHWRFRALHRLLRRVLRPHLDTISGEDEPRILDAGCGTGGTALALADRIVVMGAHGHIVWDGSPGELEADQAAKHTYLGV